MADVKKQAAENMINFRQRKRACAGTQTLSFMNEYRQENHSYEIMIMIISTQKQMIIIIVISHK